MFNEKLSFLSNNVKGIKVAEKTLNFFWYFRNLNTLSEFAFLQEKYSSVDVETKEKNMEQQFLRANIIDIIYSISFTH